jgi:hypothetical protein
LFSAATAGFFDGIDTDPVVAGSSVASSGVAADLLSAFFAAALASLFFLFSSLGSSLGVPSA